jgi:hypothetical protein
MGRPRLVRSATSSQGVTLGAGTWLTSLSNAVTTSWLASAGRGWTPQTGDALVRVAYLDNGTDVDPVSLSIGGAAVTARDKADAGHGGPVRGCGVWLGTARSLPAGSPLDVVLTTSGANGAGKIAVRITDLAGWGGTVGCHGADVVTGGLAVRQASLSRTLLGSGGLLVGIACTSDADTTELSAAGWTKTDEYTVGTTVGASNDAAVFTRTGGDAGGTVSFVPTSDTGWSEWSLGFLELL